jgi:hypothetical protein
MTTTSPATNWIRAGLLSLPVYGLLVGYATRTPQPDPVSDPDGGPASSAARPTLPSTWPAACSAPS